MIEPSLLAIQTAVEEAYDFKDGTLFTNSQGRSRTAKRINSRGTFALLARKHGYSRTEVLRFADSIKPEELTEVTFKAENSYLHNAEFSKLYAKAESAVKPTNTRIEPSDDPLTTIKRFIEQVRDYASIEVIVNIKGI